MSPRKKSSEPAIVAMARAAVKENPRGAPETVSFVQVLPVEPVAATITTTASVEPVVWEDVPAPSTAQRIADPVVVAVPPCALEGAHIGAKCVVSRTDEGKVARLLTSKGSQDLDKSDLFYTLPAGAKVQKMSETRFDAYRLGVRPDPIFSASSAREAVQRFLEVVV